MNTETIICERLLGGGIAATVSDATRHYFGGYYHVCIQVSAEIALTPACFDTPGHYEDALGLMGKQVRFSRTLEKMAVPDTDVAAVRHTLLDAFDANELPYLSRPDFPERFVRSEYARCLKSSAPSYR
jgi:hypothetical protein